MDRWNTRLDHYVRITQYSSAVVLRAVEQLDGDIFGSVSPQVSACFTRQDRRVSA